MGFCIMFPHLCGLKTNYVAEMKQIVIGLSDSLENELSKQTDVTKRKELIILARAKAIEVLEEKGYEMV